MASSRQSRVDGASLTQYYSEMGENPEKSQLYLQILKTIVESS